MSEKLCALRKIGGGMSEKTLWTNPSPNSNATNIDVTLSQDIDDFKFLKFAYKASTNNNTMGEVIISVDKLKTLTSNGVTVALIGARVGFAIYSRVITYKTDTTLEFSTAYHVYGTDTNTSMAIPLQVIGLK